MSLAERAEAKPSVGATPGERGYRRGEPGYRDITLALFAAGMATFVAMYAAQAVLAALFGAGWLLLLYFGAEALLAAFEATGDRSFLARARGIFDFFVGEMGRRHGWRLPEHFDERWQVDPSYEGNPMFRPPGTTPGHSFELGRLALQHWDLTGRADPEREQQ